MAQRKLLLADDSITIQKVVNLTFADEGIEVITVGDGDSAMAKIMESAPDLVLADVNMPGLNGYQVCEQIKQSETLRAIPVILLVGSFEPFDEAEASRVGADDFLTKPFQSIRQLVNKVNDLLNSAENGGNPATVSSFADTQKFALPESASSSAAAPQFDDEGMDDEMIQASNVSGFGLDESAKFETQEDDEISEPEDEAKTQPLSDEELRQYSFDDSASESEASREEEEEEEVYEISDQQIVAEPEMAESENVSDETDAPTASRQSSVLDEDNLLELQFGEDEEDWEEMDATPEAEPKTPAPSESQTEAQDGQTATLPERHTSATAAGLEQDSAGSESSAAFSPELIEAVADRVIEKLSDKAVREIAWEVVPQLADLIIKKMAEEKFRQ